MAEQKKKTWLEYMGDIRQKDVDSNFYNMDGVENLINLFKNIHPIFSYSVPFIYSLDYRTGKYLMCTNNSLTAIGIKTENFVNGGIAFTISNYQKDDLKIFNEKIFPDRVKFLQNVPPEEHPNYVFSYNLRLKNSRSQYSSLLQRNSFIKSDESGRPLVSMGMIINVDHYKNPNNVVQLIEKITKGDFTSNVQTIVKKTYFIHEEDELITKRETEILKYLSEGFSSKLIAAKLYLSEHTVIIHRKNLMAKTNSVNIAELISWANRNEII